MEIGSQQHPGQEPECSTEVERTQDPSDDNLHLSAKLPNLSFNLNTPGTPHPTHVLDPLVPAPPVPVPEPQPPNLDSFDLEENPSKVSALANTKRRFHGFHTSVCRTFRSFGKATGNCCLAMLIILLVLLPDGMFVLYSYYFSYAEIYFNSKTSINIFRNNNTENAFKVFYWFLCMLCLIPNGFAGYGIMALAWVVSKGVNGCLRFIWIIPWFGIFIILKTITFWIRPTVTPVWQSHVFNNGCNLSDYSAILSSSSFNNFAENLPVIGTANITFNSIAGANYTTELTRDEANHKRFDFQVTSISGDDNPMFSLITYDTQNRTYTAIRSGNKNNVTNVNVTGSYTTTPLAFPQLRMETFDPDIPFVRPGYGGCWPAAANLVIRKNDTASYINVLNSLTLDPDDDTRLKVCGMAGDVAGEFQISLGLVFIQHYIYSMCATAPNSNGAIGTDCDPDSGTCGNN